MKPKRTAHIGCYTHPETYDRIQAVKAHGYNVEQLMLLGLQIAEEWLQENSLQESKNVAE